MHKQERNDRYEQDARARAEKDRNQQQAARHYQKEESE